MPWIAAATLFGQQSAAVPAERFVRIATCRVIDSGLVPPSNPSEEASRRIDIRSTHCGQIIPPYVTRLSLHVTTYSRIRPETGQPVPAALQSAITLPSGILNFPVPGGSHITVDIDGYYVAPGTPLPPDAQAASSGTTHPVQSTAVHAPAAEADLGGSRGNVYLETLPSGHANTAAGVVLSPNSTYPSADVKLGGSSGEFGVYNSSDASLMKVRSDGPVQLSTAAFFDGRTAYFGSPGAANSDVVIPTNYVHNVKLLNPKDQTGGDALVVFFNAETGDELHSPVTKYRAFTHGESGKTNINYDSQIYFHWPNQYHYRALAIIPSESWQRETFWVKAAYSNDDPFRADMYVSGNVGIGTNATNPSSRLHVDANNTTTGEIASYFLTSSVPRVRGSFVHGGNAGGYGFFGGLQIAAQGSASSSSGSGDINFLTPTGDAADQNTDATLALRMKIHYDGKIGIGTSTLSSALLTVGAPTTPATTTTLSVNGSIDVSGNINSKYQDIAEWVPAAAAMEPGTVVILNPAVANEVMPSQRAYDTSVAGVVSTRPGLSLGEASAAKAQIATTGRVRVRVDAARAPIHIGDLLVTSDCLGTAMRSDPIEVGGLKIHRPGTLIGKALEPLEGGQGEVLVLLSLQ